MTYDIEINDQVTLDFAASAFDFYAMYFGSPPDSLWPYYFVMGPHCMIEQITIGKMYIITLQPQFQKPEQQIIAIAHEMYHRVSKPIRRGRLVAELWVEEMMASRAAYKFMEANGYGSYVDLDLKYMATLSGRLTVSELKAVRYQRKRLRMTVHEYPKGFYHSINLLAAQVDEIVGWEAMCRIVSCVTWSEWFRTLPDDQCNRVRELLEL